MLDKRQIIPGSKDRGLIYFKAFACRGLSGNLTRPTSGIE